MVAVLSERPRPDGVELRALAAGADALEVRADLVGDLDPHWLRQHFPGTLVYALRSVEEGGQFSGELAHRHARLQAAARAYDQVELEWARDLTEEMLAGVPAGRRRLSRYVGQPAELDALTTLVDRMSETPAALYVLSIGAVVAEDAVAVIALLVAAKRSDLTAFATGSAGLWTRILAPRLGAPVVFGEVGTGGQAGLPTLAQLQTDYGLPELAPVRCLYGILGRGPRRSASPLLHNRAYRMLGLPAVYLPFLTEDLERFWRIVIPALDAANLPLHGLTIITPFKERVIDLVERPSAAAAHCGAANVVWRDGDTWAADTTDTSIVAALAAHGIDPYGRRAAVVGCGAAGRAVAAALAVAGAEVFLVNRSWERGQFAERMLGLPFVPLADFSPVGITLLVHATPVTDRLPLPLTGLSKDATVLELVYTDAITPLIREASVRGLSTVDGWNVLAAEVALQFQLMTGLAMPPSVAIDRFAPFRVVDHPLIEESQ
jgi:3-dehydroquinate dehydratase/shikimate dehydrogenase